MKCAEYLIVARDDYDAAECERRLREMEDALRERLHGLRNEIAAVTAPLLAGATTTAERLLGFAARLDDHKNRIAGLEDRVNKHDVLMAVGRTRLGVLWAIGTLIGSLVGAAVIALVWQAALAAGR